MKSSLAENNAEEAFRATHTLKGLTQNLSFTAFYMKVIPLTEILRSGCLEVGSLPAEAEERYNFIQNLNIKWVFSGVVMPLLYCIFIFILVAASDTPHFWSMDHQPSKVPYFFLDYENNGWFTTNQRIWKLGTFWWLLIAVVLVLCISFLLHFLHKLCHINKLEQEKTKND